MPRPPAPRKLKRLFETTEHRRLELETINNSQLPRQKFRSLLRPTERGLFSACQMSKSGANSLHLFFELSYNLLLPYSSELPTNQLRIET